MGIDWYYERQHRGILPEEADSHWKDKYEKLEKRHKAIKAEAQFMLSLLNVEQRRRLRRWREDDNRD